MDFKEFINFVINSFVTPFFSILVGAAVVFFLWNIMLLIKKSDQPEEAAKLKSKALWGVIGIAVMVSMWGLVNFITGSLLLSNTPASPMPLIPVPGYGNTPIAPVGNPIMLSNPANLLNPAPAPKYYTP